MLFCGFFLLLVFHFCFWCTGLSVSCRIVVTCWERTKLLAVLCIAFPSVWVIIPHAPCFKSELKVRLIPLILVKPSSTFTHHSNVAFFVDPLCYLGFMFVFVSCLVCSLQPCDYLLRKCWPLGSGLWCFCVFVTFHIWWPGSGVVNVLNCIVSWSLPSSLLYFNLFYSNDFFHLVGYNKNAIIQYTVKPVIRGYSKKTKKGFQVL